MRLEVVTPTGALVDLEIQSVTAPGTLGEFNVLAEHQPGLVMLSGGAVRYEGGESGAVFIRGGIAEVRPDGLLILADEACTPETVDPAPSFSTRSAPRRSTAIGPTPRPCSAPRGTDLRAPRGALPSPEVSHWTLAQ